VSFLESRAEKIDQQKIDERWVTVEGRRVRYLHGGSGPPLLLLHGLLGYAFSWRYNLEALAKVAEVFALDLPGTGFSERVPGLDPGLGATAERVLRFMDEAGLGAADVLGTSHGGAVALTMAALGAGQGRQRVRRLVLVAPAHPWSRGRRWLIRLLGTEWGAGLFRRLEPRLGFLRRPFLARMYGDARRIPSGTLEGYLRSYTIPGTMDYGLDIVRTWRAEMGALEALLRAAPQVPTLLVWGSRDRVVPLRSAARLQRALPWAELKVLEGAGPLPGEEMPQEFNRAVADFLQRRAAGGV
jgi:4,5:9,10-diseco-3-hydroxy-5,9,17-trioxoandrosta-1(10),2-diene-4-oate hydrolase